MGIRSSFAQFDTATPKTNNNKPKNRPLWLCEKGKNKSRKGLTKAGLKVAYLQDAPHTYVSESSNDFTMRNGQIINIKEYNNKRKKRRG